MRTVFQRAKKDGGLRPCIDCRALNRITGKFHYPFPLVPSALEQLRGTKIFTKLDLHSAYNPVQIRRGDECKTAIFTHTGHYEYLVMMYGLFNAPSVFQDFMHNVLQDFLHTLWTSFYSLGNTSSSSRYKSAAFTRPQYNS
ncbi:MAG: reverse transcriptase family protein [Aeromonas sp.]